MFSSSQIVNETVQSLITIDAIDLALSVFANNHMSEELMVASAIVESLLVEEIEVPVTVIDDDLLKVRGEVLVVEEIEIPVDFMDDEVLTDDDDEFLFLFHGSVSEIPESWEVEPAPAPAPAPAPRLVRAPSRGRVNGYHGFSLRLL